MSNLAIDRLFAEFPVLHTPRLRLRALGEEDASDLLTIFGDDAVTAHYDLETFVSLEEAYELIDYMLDSYASERQARWAVERTADRRMIGTCGFVWLRPHSAEIGYDLARACWGAGYMREALQALLHYAFTKLDLNRVEALVLPANIRSQRLLSGLGFINEGVLREYDYFKGAFHDMQMHALLRRDFKPTPSP